MSFLTQRSIETDINDLVRVPGTAVTRNETDAVPVEEDDTLQRVPGSSSVLHVIAEQSRWIDHTTLVNTVWAKETYCTVEEAIASTICKAAESGVVLQVRDVGVSNITGVHTPWIAVRLTM